MSSCHDNCVIEIIRCLPECLEGPVTSGEDYDGKRRFLLNLGSGPSQKEIQNPPAPLH